MAQLPTHADGLLVVISFKTLDLDRFMKPIFSVLLFFAVANVSYVGAVNAQSKYDAKIDTKSDYEFVATVNGAPITRGLLDLNIKALINQGQKNTPELRQVIKEELINKELIAQEATKQGIAKEIDFPDQITQMKQNLLLQAYVDDYFTKNPITESRMREEYDRQRKLMGDGSTGTQYRLSQILVSNETDALDLIRRIQKGELFGKLAQEYSQDQASKVQGGSLGWVMSGQVIPAVATAMANLPKGGISQTPIQIQSGWIILKLDDKKGFKIPNFEESKPQIRQAIVQQFIAETVKNLRTNARIVQ